MPEIVADGGRRFLRSNRREAVFVGESKTHTRGYASKAVQKLRVTARIRDSNSRDATVTMTSCHLWAALKGDSACRNSPASKARGLL